MELFFSVTDTKWSLALNIEKYVIFLSHDVPKNNDIMTEVLYFYTLETWLLLLLAQYILNNFKYSKVHKAL